MPNLQRSGYTSRQARQQRAYRMVSVGSSAAIATIVTAILAIVNVIGWFLPVLFAIITVLCVVGFRSVTRRR